MSEIPAEIAWRVSAGDNNIDEINIIIDDVIMSDIDTSSVPPAAIAAFRSFNRFLTSRVGVLDEGILASPYSLPQARVLYELANSDDLSAADLTRLLAMDPAYASRLISALAAESLLEKRPDPDHGRRLTLSLTEKGRSVATELDRASSLAPLPTEGAP